MTENKTTKKLSDLYGKDHKYKKTPKKEKKIFRIACDWEVYSTMEIEATSLKEAVKIAEEDSPLPTNPDYVDGSFTINTDMTEYFFEEDHKK